QPAEPQYPAAVYDPVNARMVVFGGLTPAGASNAAWQLSLAGVPRWDSVAAVGPLPPRRFRHAAAYDTLRRQMIVFGGRDSTFQGLLDDVWALSLGAAPAWTPIVDTVGPGPAAREYASAVYDPQHDRVVVYGGFDPLGAGDLGDVWSLWLSPTPRWERLFP